MSMEGQIKELLLTSHTYTQMAEMLKVTRGVISGKIARMRARGEIDFMNRVIIMRAPPDDPATRMRVAYERLTLRVTVEGREVPPPANCEGVHLMDLQPSDCRYATARYNDQHFFCGKPRRDVKTSYCEDHHKLVWTKGTKSTTAKPRSTQARRFGDVL